MAYLLLSLLGMGLLATAIWSGEDDDDADESGSEQDDPPEPDIPQDLGASFALGADGTVLLERGADETGSLAAFVYLDTEDSDTDFVETYEARFYLIPEGVDLPENSWDTQDRVPGVDGFDGPGGYEIADLEATLGLDLLGIVDLGTDNAGHDVFEPGALRAELPPVDANAPLAVYYAEAVTDSDELFRFYGETAQPTANGALRVLVSDDTVGTNGPDWFQTGPDAAAGLSISGQDGDDVITAEFDGAAIDGEAGDDRILAFGSDGALSGGDGSDNVRAFGTGVTITGGNGADDLSLTGSGTVFGDAGNDTITGSASDDTVIFSDGVFSTAYVPDGGGPLELRGGAGNDDLSLSGDGATGFGGPDADRIVVGTGSSGLGGAGGDILIVDIGGQADGGDGDDTITLNGPARSSDAEVATMMTGGSGADLYDLALDHSHATVGAPFLRITDFDPAEDVLQISEWGPDGAIADISVTPIPATGPGQPGHTDIRVTFAGPAADPPVAIIRLEGTTDVTADDVIIVA